MKLFTSFSELAPNRMFVAVVLGAIAGISYVGIIPLVLNAVADPGEFAPVSSGTGYVFGWEIANFGFAATFAALVLLILLTRTVSQVILIRLSMDASTVLRKKLYGRIAAAPISELERIGLPKLVAAITADVPMVVAGARILPDLLTNAVTLVGMLAYLLYLNPPVFWFVVGCIFFGVVTYQVPALIARRFLVRARNHLDGLHEGIRGLVHGAKELKLNEDKRADYFARVLGEAEKRVREDAKTGQTVLRVAQNYGDLITFFVIGAVSFIFLNYYSISRSELIGVIMALLYITGPIAVLLNFLPQIAMTRIARRKLSAIFGQIPVEDVADRQAARRDWQVMRFSDVTYQYPGAKSEAGFEVGPLSLEIRKGEIAFIVGGNGSGKSTLAKLVTMHYRTHGGSIFFDDEQLDRGNIGAYRRGVSAIFSDYYLFDAVLGLDERAIQDDVDSHLEALGLVGKVKYQDGKFSTLALSDGQKRRLALVVAYLEDAELYLFDEWAADQDPSFKSVFYNSILPGLKARGKAVVVVSHDDRYFHVADRVIELCEGRLVDAQQGLAGPPPGDSSQKQRDIGSWPAQETASFDAPVAVDSE